MFLGLPSRTARTTTEDDTMPLLGPSFQSSVDQAGVDQAGHVAGHREVHVVGLEAGHDRAALVAGGAVGGLELDALAVGGLVPLGGDGLVGRLGHGEADDVQRGGPARGLRPAAAAQAERARPAASGEGNGRSDPVLHGAPSSRRRAAISREGPWSKGEG